VCGGYGCIGTPTPGIHEGYSAPMTDLPIEEALPAVLDALRTAGCAVLQAPPGAGKTTRVPLALLAVDWLAGRNIVMLEPRRLAARGAARRMAAILGEKAGATVGYRMRMDSNTGPETRIEVVTEGVLTRMMQSDPALEDTGLVIFDEFHERSLQADLGLALCLQSRALLRDDLRILVMSATLDGEPVARLLGNAPIITSEGRSFPVEVRYLDRRPEERLERSAATAVLRALREDDGDILVFLPGAGEIGRTQALLEEADTGALIAPLHGNLPQDMQDRAIDPPRSGERKVVLSTSIAETSLTIEGIRVVIDCGLMRVPRFSPRSGMTRLETVRVSKASADQRSGRAGRLGPGICYRLWSEREHEELQQFSAPEIMEADLAPLALDLACWGTAPDELAWLDAPPAAAWEQGRMLLAELGALDADGNVTAHGRMMAGLPFHPRLAHLMLHGREMGLGGLACEVAALLGGRDIFRTAGPGGDADLRLRLEALHDLDADGHPLQAQSGSAHLDIPSARRALAEARRWKRLMRVKDREEIKDAEACGLLLSFAYPDRIGQQRPGSPGRYLLRNGMSAAFAEPQRSAESPYIVVADLDGRRRESRIYLAAPIGMDEIEEHFAGEIEREGIVAWDAGTASVRARRLDRLGALILRESTLATPDPDAVATALITAIRGSGPGMLPWDRAARRMQERMTFMRHHDPSWPNVSDEALMATMEEWLAPHLHGRRRAEDLAALDLASILGGLLSWEQRNLLDAHAPTHFTVPSGSRVPIDYGTPEAPTLSVRLQEMFGQTETPRIGRGRVPLTIHLLSPANRPVQVTRDLANFWRSTYFDVRKDLKGRYPKHYWPDDPTQATPTSRVRPRT